VLPLLGLVALLAAGCGSRPTLQGATPLLSTLPGWAAAADPPGISGLAPSFSGLELTSQGDAPALVQNGDVIRRSLFVFGTQKDADEAVRRGTTDAYIANLEQGFPGTFVRREPGGGIEIAVHRPAEAGSDLVEIYLVRNGRRVTLLEFVSEQGFPPALRAQAIAALSR
jgi:hypothetical protein